MRYRLWQLWRALFGRVTPAEQRLVAALLSSGEQRLFTAMASFDQRHALDVYRVLCAAGHDDQLLLRAALLHDCGKVGDDGRPIPLLYYGLFVATERLVPALYAAAAARSGRGLWPFRLHAQHEARATRMAAAAGASPEVVAILSEYKQAPEGTPGALLRWADDQC